VSSEGYVWDINVELFEKFKIFKISQERFALSVHLMIVGLLNTS